VSTGPLGRAEERPRGQKPDTRREATVQHVKTVVLAVFAIGLMLLIVLGWLRAPTTASWFPGTSFKENESVFEAFNALFSSLAFAGVIIAILIQRAELKVQAAQLGRQSDALDEQNVLLRKASVGETLVTLSFEYRSLQMLQAVRAIRELVGKNPDTFLAKYDEICEAELRPLGVLAPDAAARSEAETLHYRRRLVSHFYLLLSGLYATDIIPSDVLFTHWREPDLRIIPEVVLPLERHLAGQLGTGMDTDPGFERLQRLYDDSKKFEVSRLAAAAKA
jgi:hypothetical protein